jgi:3-dehydro-4-phosphotetronate decarboxylase
MNESMLREEICRVGKSLFDRGYVHATAGNISVRLDGGFLITPTDACLGFLDPAKLSRIDDAGMLRDGDAPSKTLALHRQIYQAHSVQANVRCIIHTHSTHCVALTLRDELANDKKELLPPITPYFVMKVGHVPVVPYHRPGAPEVGLIAAALIREYGGRDIRLRALMLSRLGPVVFHQSLVQTMAVLEELEETAKLCHLSALPLTSPSPPAPLTENQIEELRCAFAAQW